MNLQNNHLQNACIILTHFQPNNICIINRMHWQWWNKLDTISLVSTMAFNQLYSSNSKFQCKMNALKPYANDLDLVVGQRNFFQFKTSLKENKDLVFLLDYANDYVNIFGICFVLYDDIFLTFVAFNTFAVLMLFSFSFLCFDARPFVNGQLSHSVFLQ